MLLGKNMFAYIHVCMFPCGHAASHYTWRRKNIPLPAFVVQPIPDILSSSAQANSVDLLLIEMCKRQSKRFL